jgi:DNA/RNA-binding domain of Phe-tRNA-synthetase-like protein
MSEGGLSPQGLIADALNVAVLETGVGVWAFDGLAGAPRIEQDGGRLVLADEHGQLAVLFGEPERAAASKTTRRLALVAIAVPGVADLYVHEALWTAWDILR